MLLYLLICSKDVFQKMWHDGAPYGDKSNIATFFKETCFGANGSKPFKKSCFLISYFLFVHFKKGNNLCQWLTCIFYWIWFWSMSICNEIVLHMSFNILESTTPLLFIVSTLQTNIVEEDLFSKCNYYLAIVFCSFLFF